MGVNSPSEDLTLTELPRYLSKGILVSTRDRPPKTECLGGGGVWNANHAGLSSSNMHRIYNMATSMLNVNFYSDFNGKQYWSGLPKF